MWVLIKNGNKVVARGATGNELRLKALQLIEKSPGAVFEAAQVKKRVKTNKIPSSHVVVEEDV